MPGNSKTTSATPISAPLSPVIPGGGITLKPGAMPATSAPVPFTTIVQSEHSRHATPQLLHITTREAYDAFFDGLPPVDPYVDFAFQNVIALAMGRQPTGGYSIQLTSVRRWLIGQGAHTGSLAIAHYRTTRPGPAMM